MVTQELWGWGSRKTGVFQKAVNSSRSSYRYSSGHKRCFDYLLPRLPTLSKSTDLVFCGTWRDRRRNSISQREPPRAQQVHKEPRSAGTVGLRAEPPPTPAPRTDMASQSLHSSCLVRTLTDGCLPTHSLLTREMKTFR